MKITIDIPDTTDCAFLNYVFYDNRSYKMGVRQMGSDDLYDGAVIYAKRNDEEEDDGK